MLVDGNKNEDNITLLDKKIKDVALTTQTLEVETEKQV